MRTGATIPLVVGYSDKQQTSTAITATTHIAGTTVCSYREQNVWLLAAGGHRSSHASRWTLPWGGHQQLCLGHSRVSNGPLVRQLEYVALRAAV